MIFYQLDSWVDLSTAFLFLLGKEMIEAGHWTITAMFTEQTCGAPVAMCLAAGALLIVLLPVTSSSRQSTSIEPSFGSILV